MTFSLNPGKLGFKLGEVLVGLKRGTLDVPEVVNTTDGGLNVAPSSGMADPFGWSRTSSRVVAFEYAGTYDQGMLLWEHSLAGTGSVTFDPATGGNTLSTGGTAQGAKAIRQTHEYHLYLPGRGRLSISGFIFGAAANVRRRHGLFDDNNGLYLEQTATGLRFVTRSNVSGSVVNTTYEQTDWVLDPLDGTGPSELTLDVSKANALVIDIVGYNAAKVRFGFLLEGRIQWAHEVNNLNSLTSFALSSVSLPLRYEIENTGTAASANTLKASSCVVYNEDGGSVEIGYEFTANTGPVQKAITARTPLLSLRPKATFNGITNRAHVHLQSFNLLCKTNDVFYEVVRNGVLTGAAFISCGTLVTAGAFVTGLRYAIVTVGTTDFTLIGAASNTVGVEFTATGAGTGTGTAAVANSVSNYDVTASAIVGGDTVQSGYVPSGSGAFSEGDAISFLGRLALTNNFAGTTTDILTLVATPLTGTANLSAAVTWQEQR